MLQSFQKNKKGIILMLVSSICVCVGQLAWKLSNSRGMVFLFLGFLFYGVGAIVMIIAYRYGKLSVLQPMLSMNYAISILLAFLVLDEKITVSRCLGVLVIIFGVIFIVGGDEE